MVRIPHLMLHQNFDFQVRSPWLRTGCMLGGFMKSEPFTPCLNCLRVQGGRVLILDTHGKDPGPGTLTAARSLIKQVGRKGPQLTRSHACSSEALLSTQFELGPPR
jgi:hypothetical protein